MAKQIWRVEAIVSHVEFIEVEADDCDDAEEVATSRDDWTKLLPGDWEIDNVVRVS